MVAIVIIVTKYYSNIISKLLGGRANPRITSMKIVKLIQWAHHVGKVTSIVRRTEIKCQVKK